MNPEHLKELAKVALMRVLIYGLISAASLASLLID